MVGVDINQRNVDLLNAGLAPVQETNLAETIAANRERLRATLSHREAILASDVTFVVVPTPSGVQGAFSLQYAQWAFRAIARAIVAKGQYHLVVLTSTVLPGATRSGLLPILEQGCGDSFGLCYSPAFIALGNAIQDFLNPDFTLVGEADKQAGSQLETCYSTIMENSPPCYRMSLENAELVKLAVNTFLTTKMTFANMLADLCERIPGGDVDVVTAAMGADQRIGHKYLTGALGYGGPCFPRDNAALSYTARSLGTQADLADVTDRVNRAIPEKLIGRLRPMIKDGDTVAVLGLAYKPLSHVLEESQGIYLAKGLSELGVRVVGYDPLANDAAQVALRGHAVVLDSIASCLAQADMVIITTPDPAFRSLDFCPDTIVVDCWRVLEHTRGIRYISVGQNKTIKEER